MQKQSSRIYFQGKDHKDVYINGNYHCATYLTDSDGNVELVWEKYLSEKWVYALTVYISYNSYVPIRTLDAENREAHVTGVYNTNGSIHHNGEVYVFYSIFAIYRYTQCLYVSTLHGSSMYNLTSLVTRDLSWVNASENGIYICDAGVIYKIAQDKETEEWEKEEVYVLGDDETFPMLSCNYGRYIISLTGSGSTTTIRLFDTAEHNIRDFLTLDTAIYTHGSCQYDGAVYFIACVYLSEIKIYALRLYIYKGGAVSAEQLSIVTSESSISVALLRRGGRFIIYTYSNGLSAIYTTEDFLSFTPHTFDKCVIPAPKGFAPSVYGEAKTYYKLAIVGNSDATVEDDEYEVQLPISAVASQEYGSAYFGLDGLEDNITREDMCLAVSISGYMHSLYLTVYLDNLFFNESDGNMCVFTTTNYTESDYIDAT